MNMKKNVNKIMRSIRGISTPIGGISWEAKGIDSKWVDINYPSDYGIKKELNNAGHEIRWSTEDKLSRRIDVEGWKLVVWKDQKGGQFLLKCRSNPAHLTLIMKKYDNK